MSKPFRIGRKAGKSVHIFDGDKTVAIIEVVQLFPEAKTVVIELTWGGKSKQFTFPVGQENGSEFVVHDALGEPNSFVKINSITDNQVTLLFNVAQHITIKRQEVIK